MTVINLRRTLVACALALSATVATGCASNTPTAATPASTSTSPAGATSPLATSPSPTAADGTTGPMMTSPAMTGGMMTSPAMTGGMMTSPAMTSGMTSAMPGMTGGMTSGMTSGMPGMTGGMTSGMTGGMPGMPGMDMTGTPSITGAPGSLIVLAPGTLATVLPTLDQAFIAATPGAALSPNIGHSPAQVIQLQQGSPGDVFLTVGSESMDQAVQAGLVDGTPTVFARNRLQIVVAPGNPKGITTLADLAKPGLTVVLPDTSTPVGVYAGQVLQKAGVTVKPASLEDGSPAVAQKVATGNADAGIVFVTDVLAAGSTVKGVDIPDADQVPAEYDAAVLKSATSTDTAKAYVSFLTTDAAQSALRQQGFLAP